MSLSTEPTQSKGGKRDPKLDAEKEVSTATFKPTHIKKIVKDITRLRVSKSAVLGFSAAVTYIILEILDGAKSCCQSEGKKKILPKHIKAAINADLELSSFLKNVIIQSGGMTRSKTQDYTNTK